jgi:F-type H+-transporting ATPase subunit b
MTELTQTFGVDWAHLGAQILSFSIVCAVLYRFAYTPVLAMLEQRRRQIAQGLENAEKIKAALAKIEDQRREVMAAAQLEAMRLITEARDAAARLGDQERKRAAAAAEHILRQANDAAAREHQRLRAELRRELGRLVAETTAAVAGRVLTAADQRRLAEATVKKVA